MLDVDRQLGFCESPPGLLEIGDLTDVGEQRPVVPTEQMCALRSGAFSMERRQDLRTSRLELLKPRPKAIDLGGMNAKESHDMHEDALRR
jgi:hypothetical protein